MLSRPGCAQLAIWRMKIFRIFLIQNRCTEPDSLQDFISLYQYVCIKAIGLWLVWKLNDIGLVYYMLNSFKRFNHDSNAKLSGIITEKANFLHETTPIWDVIVFKIWACQLLLNIATFLNPQEASLSQQISFSNKKLDPNSPEWYQLSLSKSWRYV